MTHEDLPFGLGIRDEEIAETVDELRAAIDRLEGNIEFLGLFFDLGPKDRLSVHRMVHDMHAMKCTAERRASH